MQILPTEIPDVKIIVPRRFEDARGFFSETWNRKRMADMGIDIEFVQDNHSWSADAGVLRGLHFQSPPHAQTKLVRVTRGRVLDVAVDLRRGSATYGRHVAVELAAANWRQLLVPAGFAHGVLTLEPDTEIQYKVDAYYAPEHDKGVIWNDPDLGIDWPVDADDVILSDKDLRQPRFADLPAYFN
ncbi:MAG: dTDP-4-dehydrorhamnose 3,5-epimerase [Phycisphaera sp.]|nr:dTDP-4-dehydrorhamnose 3,5-epimerase [Phycisphaera sp.]